jgi:Domain of unknown function (DUF4351)
MQLSPLYLEQLEAARLDGEQIGQQDLVLQLLARQVGKTSVEVERQVRSLSTDQIGFLGVALLDFEKMGDLLAGLQVNGE